MSSYSQAQFTNSKQIKNYEKKENYRAQRHKQSPSESKAIISAEVTALYDFTASSTKEIKFSLEFDCGDGDEWADLLELTFPSGVTPIDGRFASPSLQVDYYWQLNPIDGQTISWGDDNNDWGALDPSDGVEEFFVMVEIDNTISESFDIDFHLSTDQCDGIEPYDVYEVCTVDEFDGTVPDLSVSISGFVTEYYSIPIGQVGGTTTSLSLIEAIVLNLGADLTEATNANVKASNGYTNDQAIVNPLNNYSQDTVSFSPFAATKLGTETFICTANASNDLDESNGTDTAKINIHETDLIRDNGDVVAAFGIGTNYEGDKLIGNVFKIIGKDTLTAVTILLGDEAPINDTIRIDVFSFDENGPEDLIGSSDDLIVTVANQELTAYFPNNGLILEEGKYLIAIKENKASVRIALTSTEYTQGTCWFYVESEGGWIPGEWDGFWHTYYIRPGFGTEDPGFDVSLKDVGIPDYVAKSTEFIIQGTIINTSIEKLTSVDIAYSINGGTTITESFTDLSIVGTWNFTLSTPLEIENLGKSFIEVTISNTNGIDDVDLTNNTWSKYFDVIEYAPTKRILCEEGTGTWCGNCPRGAVFMDSMEIKYHDNWIGIAVHNGDPMTVKEYDDEFSEFLIGYPGSLLDRAESYDPYDFEVQFKNRIKQASPIDISIHSIDLDNATNELTFNLSAYFLDTITGARFNAMIIENGVTGSTDGYNQSNYYSGGDEVMGGYENLPNPVPAADMVYNHVARAILGEYSGVEESISETVITGETETYSFKTTLNEAWDTKNLEIIGVIISADGEILNAVKSDLIVGISSFEEKTNIRVYPNPFENNIHLNNLDNATTIEISNMLGQLVYIINVNSSNMQINTSKLNRGIYLITVLNNNQKVMTTKISKQ